MLDGFIYTHQFLMSGLTSEKIFSHFLKSLESVDVSSIFNYEKQRRIDVTALVGTSNVNAK